jgi:hypothetical protein
MLAFRPPKITSQETVGPSLGAGGAVGFGFTCVGGTGHGRGGSAGCPFVQADTKMWPPVPVCRAAVVVRPDWTGWRLALFQPQDERAHAAVVAFRQFRPPGTSKRRQSLVGNFYQVVPGELGW